MKLGTLVKGIIIYIVFILGLAILSEWICGASGEYPDDPFDAYLESIKQELKTQYINRASPQMKEYFSNIASMKNVPKNPRFYNIPEGFPGTPVSPQLLSTGRREYPAQQKEQFVSYTDDYEYSTKDFAGPPEEDEIIRQASNKLSKNNYFALQNASGTQYTLGQDYARIDKYQRPEDRQQEYTQLYKNFAVEKKKVNWDLPQVGMVLPKKDTLDVDHKYDYKYSLPQKLKIQPVANPYSVPFAYIKKF